MHDHVFRGYLRKVLINHSAASRPNTCFLLVAAPTSKSSVGPAVLRGQQCKLNMNIFDFHMGLAILLYVFSIFFHQQVCLFVVNMQETSHQVVNHLRILIEEAEEQGKLFVILLHFHPLQFFNTCYPALFLKGWDHYYLDTIAHSEVQDVVDIEDWFWQCCFPKQIPERDSLMLTLSKLLQEAVPVLSSRVFFRSSLEKSFNRPMNGLQCSKVLRELLFEKGVGEVLCQRFRSYWKPAVMAEYLQTVVTFTKDCESTLSITDSIQTKLKSLFIDFLLYLLSHITEMFNIGILFDSDCTMAVQKLFLDILHVLPLPKLSQLHVLSTRLPVPATDQSPRFPFFKVVCEAVEKIVEQTHSTINVQEDLLQEKEVESMESNSFRIYDDIYALLQESVKKTIEKKMEVSKPHTSDCNG